MATTISVNGADGATLARSSGIRLVEGDPQALVLHGQPGATRHGRPGNNAPRAIPGGPAGTLGIQLYESQISQGAIHVRVIESSQGYQIPRDTEVAIGRDLRLIAIGGIGESGQNGGDGQSGMNGVDGTGATRVTDATNGTDGGDGGAAGQGSGGAGGGPGGELHIIMDEHSTHLLMAVSWDVSGGIGGRAGKHGTPGEGGTRGIGGEGWRWEEIVGYRYFCTSSCIKRDANVHPSTSTTMVRMGSHLHASSSALTAPIGALLVSGNNLQRAIVQARRAYRAVERPSADPGACQCGGGTGTCTGCDMKPIIKNFKRAPGLDGRDGERGARITTPLLKGSKGQDGSMTLTVQHDDGSTRSYTSAWCLELVDFELEDDNADGVFEPAECLHIRRVKVRNVGGMPSPTCRITISLADHSDHFQELSAAEGGAAYLPTSIPATGEATMEGSLKVLIKPNTRPLALGARFHEKGWLQIRADMPWLERRLPSFELRKEVDIAYPCGFGEFEYLSTVAQGAISRVQYQIRNFGNQSIGEGSNHTGRADRMVEVSLAISQQNGRLLSSSGEDTISNNQPILSVRPRDVVTMQQQFRVLAAATNHEFFQVNLYLYLESPEQLPGAEAELVLVERRVISLQVSSSYTLKPNARYLLVTNPNTIERQSQAIQTFIQNSLNMEVDVCNIHQNGGLLGPSESFDEEPVPILAAYREKTIIFLDDSFDFFNAGPMTCSQLCDSEWLNTLAANNSSSLFIGTPNNVDLATGLRHSIFPLPSKINDAKSQVKPSHCFSSREELLSSIVQEKKLGNLMISLSVVAPKRKWHHMGSKKDEKAANNLCRYLCQRLPNERFIVSHDSSGQMLVFRGVAHGHCMRSTESPISLRPASDTNPTLSRLDPFSKYLIIAAIPIQKRIDILWRSTYTNQSIVEAFTLSVKWDVFEQMSRLQNSRYKRLLRTEKSDTEASDTLIKTHLPSLGYIFNHAQSSNHVAPPNAIIRILVWILAYANASKRHKNINNIIHSCLRSRLSTSTLLNSEDFKASVAACDTTDLLNRISELTQTAPYVIEKGQKSGSDVVPRTEYWPPPKWDQMVAEIQEARKSLANDMLDAKKERIGCLLILYLRR